MPSSGGSLKRKLFPSLYVTALGLITLTACGVLAIAVASGDPVDFSTQAKDRIVAIGIGIALFGVSFFTACVLSVILWVANRHWARHALLALALIGSGSIALALVSIPLFPGCTPIILIALIVADVMLVVLTYSPVPAVEGQSPPPSSRQDEPHLP